MYIYQSSGLPDVLIGEPADIGNLSYKHVNEIFSWDDLHDKGINDFFFYEGEYRIAKNRSRKNSHSSNISISQKNYLLCHQQTACEVHEHTE